MQSHQQVSAAIHRIKSRHDEAVTRIHEIEAGTTQRLIDYSMEKLTAADLNSDAAELAMLREVVQEDNREALEHLNRISQELSAQQQRKLAMQEAMERKREFAVKYNLILSRTHSPTPNEVDEIAALRPSEITGPEWHRFNARRIDFAAQPETGQTLGEFAQLELFNPTE